MRVLSARIPLLLANALRATEEDIAPAEPEQRCGTVWPPWRGNMAAPMIIRPLPAELCFSAYYRDQWYGKSGAREFNSSYGKTHTISDDSFPSP
jgi:hypothetical protein